MGTLLTRALKRDQLIVSLLLVAVIGLSWAYIVSGAGMNMEHSTMPAMDGMVMERDAPTLSYTILVFTMWAVMMAAMMLPSAAPMILFYSTIARRRAEQHGVAVKTGTFTAGYLAVWAGFSLVAAASHIALESSDWLNAMMQVADQRLTAALLIIAGVYQWTPLKQACLKRCRSPLDFITTEWREGQRGAFIMGLRHGLICVGCCWALMLLLLVGGVMSVLWIAGIALFVLIEKVGPFGSWFSRVTGAVLVAVGTALLTFA